MRYAHMRWICAICIYHNFKRPLPKQLKHNYTRYQPTLFHKHHTCMISESLNYFFFLCSSSAAARITIQQQSHHFQTLDTKSTFPLCFFLFSSLFSLFTYNGESSKIFTCFFCLSSFMKSAMSICSTLTFNLLPTQNKTVLWLVCVLSSVDFFFFLLMCLFKTYFELGLSNIHTFPFSTIGP